MRTLPLLLLAGAATARAGAPGNPPPRVPPLSDEPPAPAAPAPDPDPDSDARAGDGGGVALELAVVRPGTPIEKVASGLFYLYPREAQSFKATFVSGTGKRSRIVTLEFGLRKLPGQAPFAFELLPPREGPIRRIIVPADPERTEMHAIWNDELRGDSALLLVRRATPGEAAVARLRTKRLVRPSFRIRMRVDQEGGAARFLGASELIAPLGERATESIENVSQRMVKQWIVPDAPAVARPLPPAGAGLTPATGNVAPGLLTTADPPPPEPVAPPPVSASAPAADDPPVPREIEVPVDATDRFTVAVTADDDGPRLRWTVTLTGELARESGAPVPVAQEFKFFGYRHEKAVVRLSASGALYAYRLEFDPDWESDAPAVQVLPPPPGYNSPPAP